jgi:hypothetical protein
MFTLFATTWLIVTGTWIPITKYTDMCTKNTFKIFGSEKKGSKLLAYVTQLLLH